MSEEKFEDKTLLKKEDEKIKTQAEAVKEEAKESKTDAKTAAKEAPKAPESKKASKEKATGEPKEKKPTFVLERKYMVNLSRAYAKPAQKRANTAVTLLREFCVRHMKGRSVRIEPDVNNAIRKSIRPLKRLSVLLKKDKEGVVHAFLAS